MITPNFVFKLVSIFFILFGLLNLVYQKGINKIVGIFMIFFAYVNLLSLRNKGKKQFKLALLKINICLMAFIFLIIFLNVTSSKNFTLNCVIVTVIEAKEHLHVRTIEATSS